jgi:hypothetical protein
MSCASQSCAGVRLAKLLLVSWIVSGPAFLPQVCVAADSPVMLPLPPQATNSAFKEGELSSGAAGKSFWLGFAVFGTLGVAAVAFLGLRVRSKMRGLRAAQTGEATAESKAVVSGNGSKSYAPAGKAQVAPATEASSLRGRLRSKSKPAGKLLNHQNGSKRRKVFNYHKFYTEMVLQVSPATRAESFEGYPAEVNGYGVYSPPPERLTPEQRPVEGAATEANSEIIANQRVFIEEQKRLIEEQGRLIEEKSKLIAEKNQLLKRQSELIDNNLV